MRVADLPLGSTEDRVIGSVNIEALLQGKKVFEHGILAEANQGILYVDEINLLDNYLVNVLLDAAAMGINTVEREGASFQHPAQFILVGTMNPEEGELRPQLLDRLGLAVQITGEKDVELRTQIMQSVRAFNKDPEGFRGMYEESQQWARDRIVEARELLPSVTCSDKILELVAEICIDFGVDGHRSDIIIEKCARTHAAYNLRTEVTKDDIIASAELVLPHRMRKQPLEEEEFSYEMLAKLVEEKELY
jgi:magnesium chelatase subunit I